MRAFRKAYANAGHDGTALAAVTRPVFPITSDDDRRYFGRHAGAGDSVGILEGMSARSGPQFVGGVEDVARMLESDEGVTEADCVLFAMPSQLGVDYNAHWMANLVAVARELGWK